ncbi:MAG: hypothetical protein NTU83_05640, partial [Candidatus Hydrogenedentes bacterium]|nr:hypothetical protein [Candidatus Hydrogenedentota bacterium]
LPEPPTALSGYSSEPVRPAPLASAFDFDDLDAGATPSSDATRDPLVAHRELSSPEDDLAELSRAVDHLKVAPKPSPLPARPATEAADDDWTEPKSAAVLRTEPALGVRDLAEAEQLLQELELQPRDVAPPSSDKSAAPTDEHVNNDDEDDAPVHR